MGSIYMILLAIYLLQIATNISNKYEKANYYRGWFVVGSILCFLISFIYVVIK